VMCSRTAAGRQGLSQASKLALIRGSQGSAARKQQAVDTASDRPRATWMTVLPLSLFMLRIAVFFLPLTVVVFQRKRSESLNGLLLRIDLRRGTLRCQARPDLWGLQWMQLRLDKHALSELLSKNPCMWLGRFHVSKPLQAHGG
jgi:hypothetical protein